MNAQLDIFETPSMAVRDGRLSDTSPEPRSFAGRDLRDHGMRAVSRNAGDGWRDLYRRAVNRWFDSLAPGHPFSSETLRSVARAAGVGEPHHYNAWSAMAGAFIRQWLRDGSVVITGEAQAKRPQAHATKVTEYART